MSHEKPNLRATVVSVAPNFQEKSAIGDRSLSGRLEEGLEYADESLATTPTYSQVVVDTGATRGHSCTRTMKLKARHRECLDILARVGRVGLPTLHVVTISDTSRIPCRIRFGEPSGMSRITRMAEVGAEASHS
ncbi:hypothetical protein Efla_002128 [Eimeria flavescens]